MKIQTKIAKLQMHENSHKNRNENKIHSHFYSNVHDWQLKLQIC